MAVSKTSADAYYKAIQKQQREQTKAQKEASKNIEAAQKAVKDAEFQAREQIDYIREENQKARLNEIQKHEQKIVDQKSKGEEVLSKQQIEQNAAIRKARKRGEDRIAELQDHYDSLLLDTEKDSLAKITDVKAKNQQEISFEENAAKNLMDQSKHIYTNRIQQLDSDMKYKAAQIDAKNQAEMKKMKEFYQAAKEKTHSKYKTDLNNLMNDKSTYINNEYKKANQSINEIRNETTRQLNAYSERQSDPFYQMMRTDATLFSEPDSYIIKATIPRHEQEHVTVNVRGNQIVLTGRRRHENTIEEGPGKVISTAAYQSFTETFPIADQVDPRKLSKRFDGETLTIVVPKTNNRMYSPFEAKPNIKEVSVHKPKFPENIPVTPDLSRTDPDNDGSSGPLG